MFHNDLPVRPCLLEQDENCVICFATGCAGLASLHLNVDQLPQDIRPLRELLTNHLSQGVYLFQFLSDLSRQHANDISSVAEVIDSRYTQKDENIVDLSYFFSVIGICRCLYHG